MSNPRTGAEYKKITGRPMEVKGKQVLQLEKFTETQAFHENISMEEAPVRLEDLLAAQKDPQKYANLQVRVCGWNEYFVKMTRQKQDDFISRCRTVNG